MHPAMSSGTTSTQRSGGRFPPTTGKTTITTSSVPSAKASSTSSSKEAKSSTGSSRDMQAKGAKNMQAKGAFTRAKTVVGLDVSSAESARLKQDIDRTANWKRWGPYLSERQWSTVREDYSPDGSW